jgi:arsenate reductase
MAKPLLLSYSGCGTCRNALKWLKEHDVAVDVRALLEQAPTRAELNRWVPASGLGVRKWLNTSGLSYRALGKAKVDAADDATLLGWLAADPKLIKRPVLVHGAQVLVGFKAERYAALLGR